MLRPRIGLAAIRMICFIGFGTHPLKELYSRSVARPPGPLIEPRQGVVHFDCDAPARRASHSPSDRLALKCWNKPGRVFRGGWGKSNGEKKEEVEHGRRKGRHVVNMALIVKSPASLQPLASLSSF
jgi:hypothetical protein